MLFQAQTIPYRLTNYFSPIVLDYLQQSSDVKPFFSFAPTLEGIKAMIEDKKKHKIDRDLLVQVLTEQYATVTVAPEVQKNLELLKQSNSFTITTAHQPNLFTGPLYFMYKILHAIKLADSLKQQLPGYNFIPVYYMGSEDADFAELNHTYIRGKKIEWQKVQTGAVGRMKVDQTLIQLIDEIQGQLYFEQYAPDVIDLLKRCYTEGKDIQTATFEIVNELYGKYGLVVLIPDNANLKRQLLPVFQNDIFEQTSSAIVAKTSEALGQKYKVQAHPREINLFYLKDDIRERIINEEDNRFIVHGTNISFTVEELQKELETHPERFSPNVILRGLYQETILPNIAFIGGGGELAYWLQLKNLFEHYKVPFPVLILRNSFLIIEKDLQGAIDNLGVSIEDLFKSEFDLLNTLIERQGKRPALNGELTKVEEVYEQLDRMASGIDVTLSQHIAALKARTIKQLLNLEKKMFSAERKKQEALKNKISKFKQPLFPKNGLQERIENFSSFHSKWGSAFIDEVYKNSPTLEQEFVVLKEVKE